LVRRLRRMMLADALVEITQIRAETGQIKAGFEQVKAGLEQIKARLDEKDKLAEQMEAALLTIALAKKTDQG
jgi:uncharacterized phage infection (PIP) family protein YhgE